MRTEKGAIIPTDLPNPMPRLRLIALTISALSFLLLSLAPGRADVKFDNCVRGSDGSITCDTVPTGNTLLNDKDAQYGLLQNASPGWSEFDPYEGYGEDFGDDPY